MIKTAVFSPDRKYRYALWRIWDERKPVCMFIGLNPSTADEYNDDPTIRRCFGFAAGWGYGGFCMTNIYAYCSANPDVLQQVPNPAGLPENDDWLRYLAAYSGIVVACWSNYCYRHKRADEVAKLLQKLYCLGTTRVGQPRHPLYLPKGTKLQAFKGLNPA